MRKKYFFVNGWFLPILPLKVWLLKVVLSGHPWCVQCHYFKWQSFVNSHEAALLYAKPTYWFIYNWEAAGSLFDSSALAKWIPLEHYVFFYETYAKYSSDKKCCKLRQKFLDMPRSNRNSVYSFIHSFIHLLTFQ